MRFHDLCWMDVDRYLQRDNRVILVLGGTEQHAYLSLTTDTQIAEQVAQAAGERSGVLVAPALSFAVGGQFADFPGSISLSRQTFEAVLLEVVESLLHQGFRRLLVVNGHAGNRLPQHLRDLEMDGLLRIVWFDWWRGMAAQTHEDAYGLRIDHGNWSENFDFTRVRDCPKEPKPEINLDAADDHPLRELLGDGSFGGPYEIAPAIMQALFDALVDEATALLETL